MLLRDTESSRVLFVGREHRLIVDPGLKHSQLADTA
jgi:hypothetical protein